ncbi:YceI family protein [Paenibacillus sp. SC116]|uniref:YceI family protein n=1 Tax=Paenibacillus sp. SC116 TaxID=2968986 RepID=UPI00215AED16|nr:YceI family protein [Paenibacillus sp. SC116]MCR8846138.1 YceI family protein [Paenibacillus sp. SC116]
MKKKIMIIGVAAAAAIGIGGYALYDYYVGNHINIKASASENTSNTSEASTVTADQLNKTWTINKESKVYFSVTTSKETVNFEMNGITGTWDFNLQDPAEMKAIAKGDMNQINSGNSDRDGHLKAAEYFDVAAHPEAVFETVSFEQWNPTWTEGKKQTFIINGKLTVKGKAKEVRFEAESMFKDGKLYLDGATKVTFGDFGIKAPDSVVAKTQEEIQLTLRTVLE